MAIVGNWHYNYVSPEVLNSLFLILMKVIVLKKLSDDWYIPSFSEELNSSNFDKYVSIVDDLPIISFEEGIKRIIVNDSCYRS